MKIKNLITITVGLAAISFTSTVDALIVLSLDDSSGNTVVTLTATDFTTEGLTESSVETNGSTYVFPAHGRVAYTGSSDTSTLFQTAYAIPTFSFGTGGLESEATNLSADNPFIFLNGFDGNIVVNSDNPPPSNFIATATYSGTLEDNGIDTTPQSIDFVNGQTLSIVPEPSFYASMIGILALGFVILRRRKA